MKTSQELEREWEPMIRALRAALQHALICDMPQEIKFRCTECEKAEAVLKQPLKGEKAAR